MTIDYLDIDPDGSDFSGKALGCRLSCNRKGGSGRGLAAVVEDPDPEPDADPVPESVYLGGNSTTSVPSAA